MSERYRLCFVCWFQGTTALGRETLTTRAARVPPDTSVSRAQPSAPATPALVSTTTTLVDITICCGWPYNCVITLLLHFFYRISSSHIFNSVCWSHALVNGPTSKRPASDGGRCSGQLLMMWSAVCSGSPHSHAALSASPHFFMEALYRPTPVRSLFRVVQCFRLSSSPLTPSSGSDTWRCTRVGPDASHSCFHVAAIHASFDRSSGMTLSISWASLL